MKYLLILSVCIVLSICAGCSDSNSILTKDGLSPLTESKNFNTVCIEGVEYFLWREKRVYSGYGYMSVKFKKDGNISTCGN